MAVRPRVKSNDRLIKTVRIVQFTAKRFLYCVKSI
nr:MAG TPA: hypothetical protein [Caudoviricetes sp.]